MRDRDWLVASFKWWLFCLVAVSVVMFFILGVTGVLLAIFGDDDEDFPRENHSVPFRVAEDWHTCDITAYENGVIEVVECEPSLPE